MTMNDMPIGNTKLMKLWAQNAKNRTTLWFLTINNPTAVDIESLKEEDTKYICFQSETGSKKHIPHIHAVLRYKNARSFKSIKDKWPTAHIEGVKNFTKCREYCLKERTFTGLRFERVGSVIKTNEDKRTIEVIRIDPDWEFNTITDILKKYDAFYPPHMVESWDNIPLEDDWIRRRSL